jgi:hypothetical protein
MFTPDEEALIRLGAKGRGIADRLWFYAAVLVGPLLMALYGLVRRDYLALAVAFFALFALVVWSILREQRYAAHYLSMFRKLEASELLASGKAGR